MSKQFAVLGLGSFGWSVALTLEKMGADVLVVDESFEKIQEISEQVSYAVKADVSDPEALEALGGRNLKILRRALWRPCCARRWASRWSSLRLRISCRERY